MWEQLVPSPSVVDQMFEEIFATNALLFAEEKPNQFRDPEATLRRAARFAELGAINQTERRDIQERTKHSLHRLDEALSSGAKYDAVTMHMLATRLLLTSRVLSSSDDVAPAISPEMIESIISRLGLGAGLARTQASAKSQVNPNQHSGDIGDASAESRYNIA